MCRKLAISQAANGRSFKFMVEIALDIAKQWRWSEQLAKMLVSDLKEYHKYSGVFSGRQARLVGDPPRLGGVQSVKRCSLSVGTFESLSKLRASYANFLHKIDQEAGKPARHKHAHMHTQPERGLDTALADQLQRSFAWVPLLTSDSRTDSDEQLLEEFDRFEHEMRESHALQNGSDLFTDKVPDVFAGDIIDRNELEKVDQGIAPTGIIEEIV
ncbi:hypothetical protein K503DRAFT_863931 [Rhizopogon vinicolor AM-OR11-026]|uniref:Uncharacterized protein n=1 Tax=Rhizopogon vinicolor AM-OR11-026 TaxID=1314800 RepID=A0A1B7N929_9AGAM|nr:hypothetical protein K503DRAFT_863931 [Rhizopogon vinicolor AM-OR11-026]